MFKMEHLIEQGEKSNEAIDAIKKECLEHVEQIKNSKKTFEGQCGDILSTMSDNIMSRMESLDKELRQGGMDTVQSSHTIEDIKRISE